MNINALSPTGLHVTGVIRFAMAGRGTSDERMLDHFDLLGRSYEDAVVEGEVPALKPHPIVAKLARAGDQQALREIPVTLLFQKIENNLSAQFEAYDTRLNRLVCVGDGERCARASVGSGTAASEPCFGPSACAFANRDGVRCQLRVRLSVQIDGQDDPLSVFELQSGGVHTYRNLSAKLTALRALLGRLRGVPLTIRSYERGSPAHGWQPFQVADLVLRPGTDLATLATAVPEDPLARSFDALEEAVEAMRKASPFVVDDEEGALVSAASRRTDSLAPPGEEKPDPIAAVVHAAQAATAAQHGSQPTASSAIDQPAAAGVDGCSRPEEANVGTDTVPCTHRAPGGPTGSVSAGTQFQESPIFTGAGLPAAKIPPLLEQPPTPI